MPITAHTHTPKVSSISITLNLLIFLEGRFHGVVPDPRVQADARPTRDELAVHVLHESLHATGDVLVTLGTCLVE